MALVGYAEQGVVFGTPPELAYVFRYNSTTHDWDVEQRLTAGAPGDYFGQAVSGSGNVVVVGSPAAGGIQGAAYVFRYGGFSWDSGTSLTASDGAPGDSFGSSVSVSSTAVSGDVVIVGAPGDNGGSGAAYVYRYNGSIWVETKLIAAGGMPGDLFGHSVSIHGDVAVVGSPAAGSHQGAIYVFHYGGGIWDTGTELTASDGAPRDAFGSSVSVSDDLVLAGAPNADSAKGLAYVFQDIAGTWTKIKQLGASDRAANDQFGSAVSISSLSGNAHVALVAAPQPNNPQGAAYVYTFPAPVPTPASGSPVSVMPVDPLTQLSATVTFPNVTQAGETSLATIDSAQAPPLGFTPSGTTTYFDLTTTAQYGPRFKSASAMPASPVLTRRHCICSTTRMARG